MFVEIPDTNGFYSVNEFGEVRSNDREIFNNGSQKMMFVKGKVLKPYLNNKGYYYVDMMIDGKRSRQLVHRLVAKTFLQNPNNYPIINHLDNNPQNNCVENLEWCDYSRNNKYGYECGRHKVHENFLESARSPKTYLWKPVTCIAVDGLTEIKRYNSIMEAAKDIIATVSPNSPLSCVRTNIAGVAKGKAITAYGFKWKYTEEIKCND